MICHTGKDSNRSEMPIDDLPPLFFDPTWDRPPLPAPRSTGYTYTLNGQQGFQGTFPTDLFGCFSVEDTGLNCFCAHCCCSYCIYASAMKYAGVQGSTTAAISTYVAGAIPNNKDGSSGIAKTAASAAATALRANVRQNLIRKFYPEGYSEGMGWSIFVHACCFSCAWCQEVNAVMVWSQHVQGKKLYYGSASGCRCANLVDANNRLAYADVPPEFAPKSGIMERLP